MIIYLIKNTVNGKVYIGKTVMTVKRRFNQHCKAADNIAKPRQILVQAIKKYGRDAFTVSVIAQASTGEELNRLECYFIKAYQSRNNKKGYNIRAGGDGFGFGNKIRSGAKLSDSHKAAISKANKHPKSEETKARMSLAQKKCKGNWVGRKHSEETKARLSAAHKGRKHGKTSLRTRAKLSLINLHHEITENAYIISHR